MTIRFISRQLPWQALVLLSVGASFANAQAPAPAAPAAAPAPYRSSFDGYQPYTDEKAVNWKEANDEVGRIGGWRAYAKEAQGPAAQGTPAAGTAADPHAGHGKPAQVKP
ncbi:MAG TPA: hypothetical protein VE934_06655 [Polaromonas sp.]|uniref:hypothetical protein n=1 Tax=Polaromonas sp. TaxID=1869339 RepID=UPI002D4FEFBB|nr:hypothetical protein [Polaromonas sp.]HYW56620.1 hypothetical protein [Polaromonas sp.]